MLMPRLEYQLNAYNPELSVTIKMQQQQQPQQQQQQQQQHINQLLNTAATATGIVGDVDALLTPLQSNNTAPARTEHGRERNLWRTNEIMEVLTIMQEIKALEMLSVKTVKSESVFRKVERIMHLRGFYKKSHVQIWTKWKFLKSTYTTSRRNGVIPKMIPQPIYEELHKMLQNTNTNCSGRSTSDCGNSATSLDGDDSNGATTTDNGTGNESKLIISGVEGGYGRASKSPLEGAAAGQESDEENGLAHPIFGFRLGLVKQEPADTGYEPVNAKEKDSTSNIQFQTEVKQEINEGSASPPVPTSPDGQTHIEAHAQSQQPQRHTVPEIMILSRRPARPSVAISTNVATFTPNVNSTPKIGINTLNTPSQPRPSTTNIATLTPLPPLRIAPFAKVPPDEITTTISNTDLPPPPPLAMNPTSRALRLNSAYSSGANISPLSYQRKTINISSPQTLNNTTSERQPAPRTYQRNQEVVMPDLDGTPAPHEYRAPQPFFGFPDGPSTSQQAQQQQAQQMEARKRHLKTSLLMSTMQPKKITRMTETVTKATPGPTKQEFNCNMNDDEQNFNSNENKNSRYQTPPQQGLEPPLLDNTEYDKNHSRILQDMALSLRQIQREAINDFFQRQMKLAREEHQFQMRQDELLMQAFREQALQFQKLGKEILGSAVKLEKRKKRLVKQAQKKLPNNGNVQTQKISARNGENVKILHNGKCKPKREPNDDLQIHKKEVKILMKNVHAQLGLTDDEDEYDEQNQYEYNINDYLHDNSTTDLEHKSTEALDNSEGMSSDKRDNYTSDPIQILG
ncbi:uncharacterized protein LOC101461187 [Ceratitis capitata]|uniref:(Mediterranean fruit fly) hypothetical protein n=1 Tax=Ceratitis capitata TaxID=7213 RepID=A0A811TXH8_CERCA|nr:uncharacterized protein LOC101461187 [Ceratitis capitata]XP_020718085.1 uncharacterized protein LOC101461187 [Ceratitis capitata]XP_020718086.1 uncharacterized protein LOC101461187 [Ceratitis capitata]CAD6991534.1 unnamed protein product [Ceratitis capitata]